MKMIRFVSTLGFWLVLLLTGHGEPQTAATVPPDPILGKWIWLSKHKVAIANDGTAIHSDGHHAKWRFLGNKEVERKYEFIWNEGVFIDNVRLSKDGKKTRRKEQEGRAGMGRARACQLASYDRLIFDSFPSCTWERPFPEAMLQTQPHAIEVKLGNEALKQFVYSESPGGRWI